MGFKINAERDATIRRMWESGARNGDIAAATGLTSGGVTNAAYRLGLKPRTTRATAAADERRAAEAKAKALAEAAPKPRAALAAPDWTVRRDALLVASHGRYTEICALAERWGMPIRRVMARYHAVRP